MPTLPLPSASPLPLPVPADYRQTSKRSNKHWEDVSLYAVAKGLGMSYMHIWEVMTGREFGSMALVHKIAGLLEWPPDVVVYRIEQCRRDRKDQQEKQDKKETKTRKGSRK
jgi:hypothetical protein